MAQHAKQPEPSAEEQNLLRRSRRVRRILIVIIIILVVLLAACVIFSLRLMRSSEQTAEEQTQTAEVENVMESGESADDDLSSTAKTTNAPEIANLLGLTLDEAVDQLQRGAQVTDTQDMGDAGGVISSEATVTLTDEESDSSSGSPIVYLDLDSSGNVVKAGYSTSLSSLGYGSHSFYDAVTTDAIVESTFAEAGIELGEGAVSLPEDSAEYSDYEDDGTTLTRESYTFSGNVVVDDQERVWQAVLLYDYTTARATGNLSDTVRTIGIYIGLPESE